MMSILKEMKDIKKSLAETKTEQEERLRKLESSAEHAKGVQESDRNRALVSAVESAMSKNSDSATRNVEALCGEFRDLKRSLTGSQSQPPLVGGESMSRSDSLASTGGGSVLGQPGPAGGRAGGEQLAGGEPGVGVTRAKTPVAVNNKPFSTAPGRKGADIVSKAYGKPRSRPQTPLGGGQSGSRPATPTDPPTDPAATVRTESSREPTAAGPVAAAAPPPVEQEARSRPPTPSALSTVAEGPNEGETGPEAPSFQQLPGGPPPVPQQPSAAQWATVAQPAAAPSSPAPASASSSAVGTDQSLALDQIAGLRQQMEEIQSTLDLFIAHMSIYGNNH